jgi:hypothetical protein
MNDMSQVIIPKSDQINADDLIAGPKTYRIEDVEIRAGTEQPVSIYLAGESRAWKPCKSMSRVLVAAWGPDANAYKGRSVTLYRDPKVKWGGMEIGGIRVSHLSDIDREMLLQLTATKGKRAPHIVKPLTVEPAPQQSRAPQQGKQSAKEWTDAHLDAIDECAALEDLDLVEKAGAKAMAKLEREHPDLHLEVTEAYRNRREALSVEGRDQSQHGGQHDGTEPFND